MPELVLSPDELAALTGYRQPAAQLAELHRLGYFRARRSIVSGKVIVERAHYEAVARGEATQRPQVRLPNTSQPRLRAPRVA